MSAVPVRNLAWSQRSETMLSLSLLGIIGIMLVPLPPFMLDLLLAVNLSFSILLLLITLGVRRALDLSVFPSLLLVLTLYRLSLNVASTRRILLSANGGHLVAAFGSFVVGGNLVVGFVIFLILIIIQFIVITKGSGRVSEVSARFTLDALPGKQLAIDADLNAGVIDDNEARRRRDELGQETEFYGAMDGASKFVRGDAIAGLIITAINLLGGIILGVGNGLSLSDSVKTYSILTIGDGLVSQIPALIIAVTAGILVTKMTSKDSLGEEIETQILENDRPLWIGVGFMGLLVMMPGLPKFPFLAIGGALLLMLARKKSPAEPADETETPPDKGERSEDDEADLRNFLLTDRATIEVGARLVGLVKPSQSKGLAERIRILRREFSQQRGIWIPPIRVRSNFDLEPESYQIVIAGRTVGEGRLRSEKKLAIPPENCKVNIPGESTQEPAFGLPALWIEASLTRQAETHGYTVVDAAGVMITHLGELLKRYGHELITRETLKEMMNRVQEFAPTIVDEIKAENIRMSLLHQVVRQLAAESVSLADFALVLESVANNAGHARTADDLTDAVRMELGQIICRRFHTSDGRLRVIACEPQLESRFHDAVRDGRLALAPETIESFTAAVAAHLQNSARTNQPLAFLADRSLRRPLQRLLSNLSQQLGIISYQELPEEVSLEPVAVIQAKEINFGPRPAGESSTDAALQKAA
ncbi:MAG: flagellar biosynthesis protein FlhA [Planctomycetaceae bacterium]